MVAPWHPVRHIANNPQIYQHLCHTPLCDAESFNRITGSMILEPAITYIKETFKTNFCLLFEQGSKSQRFWLYALCQHETSRTTCYTWKPFLIKRAFVCENCDCLNTKWMQPGRSWGAIYLYAQAPMPETKSDSSIVQPLTVIICQVSSVNELKHYQISS